MWDESKKAMPPAAITMTARAAAVATRGPRRRAQSRAGRGTAGTAAVCSVSDRPAGGRIDPGKTVLAIVEVWPGDNVRSGGFWSTDGWRGDWEVSAADPASPVWADWTP
jgi:hypothetical protein